MESFGVGRLEIAHYGVDAVADDLLGLRIEPGLCCQVLCPAIERAVLGGAMTVVVDHSVPQDAIEPGRGRFSAAETFSLLGCTSVGALHDVFRSGAGVNSPPNELEKLISLTRQIVNWVCLHVG